MPTLKLTSKRQATFPKETCEALRLNPGDVINLEQRDENGETIWILRPKATPQRRWLRQFASHAKKVSDHSMDAVRKSIAEGRWPKA